MLSYVIPVCTLGLIVISDSDFDPAAAELMFAVPLPAVLRVPSAVTQTSSEAELAYLATKIIVASVATYVVVQLG